MELFFLIIKWVGYIIGGLILLTLISLLAYRKYLKISTKIETPNGVSSLEQMTLGYLKQWIFIRGTDQRNPVLLFLHGGPGAPMGGMSTSRKFDRELIKHFTIVHWDQRGAGKSFNTDIAANQMSINRLVEDCNELIDHLRNRFQIQKIFLVGHSGGSIIGIKAVYKYPEKIHAYVGIAQIINDADQQKLSYNFIVEEAKKSGDVKKQNAIKALGTPPYSSHKKMLEKAGHIVRYGGMIHNDLYKKLGTSMLSFITSPEYSISEGIKTFRNKGLGFTMNAMWEDLKKVDFTKEIRSIKVPIYFFAGKYDMITPTVLVEDFYKNLDAEKGKKLFIFENSAHVPMIEEKEKYLYLMINVVLKEIRKKSSNLK